MSTHTQSIVLLEQHQPTSLLYQRALQHTYHVVACLSIEEATEALQHALVAAFVLEPLRMYGRGWPLIERIRTAPATHTLPIIVCSELDERRHAQELGVTVYLLKPVLPTVLLATLRQVIGAV